MCRAKQPKHNTKSSAHAGKSNSSISARVAAVGDIEGSDIDDNEDQDNEDQDEEAIMRSQERDLELAHKEAEEIIDDQVAMVEAFIAKCNMAMANKSISAFTEEARRARARTFAHILAQPAFDELSETGYKDNSEEDVLRKTRRASAF